MLEAIAFCMIALGFTPRFAPENSDNAENRLHRIEQLVSTSRFGIHDLSRCQAENAGDFARMNMPFELGLDYGSRQFGDKRQRTKAILILERNHRDYMRALSDISGWDIRNHDGNVVKAVRRVRDWLIDKNPTRNTGAAQIFAQYSTFQEWFFERAEAQGASLEDVLEYPFAIKIKAMEEWSAAGGFD